MRHLCLRIDFFLAFSQQLISNKLWLRYILAFTDSQADYATGGGGAEFFSSLTHTHTYVDYTSSQSNWKTVGSAESGNIMAASK